MSIDINDLSRLFENNEENNQSKDRYDVKLIGERWDDAGEKKTLILRDHRDYTIEFPYEMYTINSLSIHSGDTLSMSKEMYDTWFQRAYHQEYKHISDMAYSHFGKLLENSDLILRHEAYSRLRLPFLYSYMFYVGSRSYSIGSLLKSWIQTDTFLLNNGAYMMSVSGSPLSGRGMYKAWCPKKKEIIHKELSGQDKSGMMYFKDFEGLEKENSDRNISDLIHLKELLNDLCIQE